MEEPLILPGQLSEEQTQDALAFGNSALFLATGHEASEEVLRDGELALRGTISFDEAIERAASRARQR